MITTVSESCYNSLTDKPIMQGIDKLGLKVTIADGSPLRYMGYIDCAIVIPFLSNFTINVPVLVVPDTDFNHSCPIIIGTNVIRICKESCHNVDVDIPEEWETAMCKISCHSFTVKSLNKKPVVIQPYDTVLIKGITRKLDPSIVTAVTENIDGKNNILICPRVVKDDNKSQTTFSVKVCNISAKAYTIKPKSDFCQLNEVKVVDNWVPDNDIDSDNSNSSSTLEDMGVIINNSDLSEAQLFRVRQVKFF